MFINEQNLHCEMPSLIIAGEKTVYRNLMSFKAKGTEEKSSKIIVILNSNLKITNSHLTDRQTAIE